MADLLLREKQSLSDAIEDFTSKYNSAPIELIRNDISVDELMDMFHLSEEDAIDLQNEIIEGKASGGYVSRLGKIFIFAGSNPEDVEDTLFHENIHAVLHGIYGEERKDVAEDYCDAAEAEFGYIKNEIAKYYKPYEVKEEVFVYILSNCMRKGRFEDIEQHLPRRYETLLEYI